MTVIKKTRKQLKRQIIELKGSKIIAHTLASSTIKKASTDTLMGSGVLIQLTGIGGKEIINPVLIRDGLSNDTIEAIKRDIKRSENLYKMV